MIENYLVLALMTLCAFVSAFSFLFGTLLFWEKEEKDTDIARMTYKAKWIVSLVFVVCSAVSFFSYKYLSVQNPSLFAVLLVWYCVGFLSRLALLVWRHDLFSPIFATNDLEILPMFFYATGGPVVTAHLIYEVIRCKGDPLYWLKDEWPPK